MAAPPIMIHREPEAMSTRARVLLAAHTIGMGAISVTMIAASWMYQSIAWRFILETPSLIFWAVAFGLAALVCGVAWWTRSADWARFGLLGSAVIAFGVATGIGLAWVDALDSSAPFSPLIPILLLLLVVADGVIGAQPIRVPLEPLVRRFRGALER